MTDPNPTPRAGGSQATASSLMLLRADTPVHVGSGATLSVIDLPIAREKLTRFPIIPGSGLKGALRQLAGERCGHKAEAVMDLFGPEATNASDFAGAVSFAEARILLYPVRSMKGLFAWLTCPTALHRLSRDSADSPVTEGARALADALAAQQMIGDGRAFTTGDACVISGREAGNQRVVLEEFSFAAERLTQGGGGDPLRAFGAAVQSALGADAEGVADRLIAVSDDVFRYFTLTATEVNAHVSLNPDTKTADEGKLFYVEDLPSESVFFSRLTFSPQRRAPKGGERRSAEGMRALFEDTLGVEKERLRFQVGGHETTGRGRITAWLEG